MNEIDLSGCGRSILISMIHDLRKRVRELEVPASRDIASDKPQVPEYVREAIIHLFLGIGSWTHSRWDQHLRNEYGDEITDKVIRWMKDEGILYSIPMDASAGFEEK